MGLPPMTTATVTAADAPVDVMARRFNRDTISRYPAAAFIAAQAPTRAELNLSGASRSMSATAFRLMFVLAGAAKFVGPAVPIQ